ncbi:glycosyltransferase [Lapillicoccus jejuensis]|uniref:Glycosyltransferase involved in cell wall biosynthesis n=1 Tax=Lapillicoccus jejuensis TaxID=402171 RepID=A0A542E2L5_9MICO|nr:glycosyltransferase [Lapillicoccus jejuensis]TQJ09573.1 glycosyltransferase involved in cell wall biosynthesis [Lapillicoccus jejuensis]
MSGVCLVGPGFRFLSGLSVYTCRLANALAQDGQDVDVVLLDRLVPARLYPGGHRVGAPLSSLAYDPRVRVAAQVDWYGAGLVRALAHLRRRRPRVLVLQWWTAATLHTYLALALAARRLGVPVVLEFHELQDTGEAAVPLVAPYRAALVPTLLRLASGALVHTEHDREMLQQAYGDTLAHLHVEVAPHGPYDHLPTTATPPGGSGAGDEQDVTRLLFFGLIRPYKGLEDLAEAFDGLTDEQARRFRLTVVGETWEGWTRPTRMLAGGRHRDRVEVVNEYVTDEAAGAYFAAADAVVLPYRRGSASGPLQIAMSRGLHVVLYAVGGLVEAVRDYPGARLVPPDDVAGLRQALLDLEPVRHERFPDPHSWDRTTAALDRLARPGSAAG